MDTMETSVQVRTFINKFYKSELTPPYFQFSECNCDTDGTAKCDAKDGTCRCKENVMEPRCDQCKDGFWGTPGDCKSNSSSQDILMFLLQSFLQKFVHIHVIQTVFLRMDVIKCLENVYARQDLLEEIAINAAQMWRETIVKNVNVELLEAAGRIAIRVNEQ